MHSTPTTSTRPAHPAASGGKWCCHSTRLAIYLRDGLACVWCGSSLEDGARLSLDHVVPNHKGGSNRPTNLVTACSKCNSSRGTRSVPAFARAVAEYVDHGITASQIVAHVNKTRRRALPRDEARTILARRGTVIASLAEIRSTTGEI